MTKIGSAAQRKSVSMLIATTAISIPFSLPIHLDKFTALCISYRIKVMLGEASALPLRIPQFAEWYALSQQCDN